MNLTAQMKTPKPAHNQPARTLPNGWREVKLGEVVDNISNTYKFLSNEKVVFLNTSDILLGRVLNHSFENSENLPGQAKKRIKKGDLLFSEIRPANGRFALIDFNAKKYVVSTKLMVLRCREGLDKEYFKLYLTSNDILKYLQMLAEDRSGTFPQITFNHIEKLETNLPPLPEQKAIAEVLSSLDDKIDLLHRQNKTLENIAQTLFRKWFIEEADAGWEEKPLDKIADYLNGLACQKYPPKNGFDKLPVLKIKELRNGFTEHSDWATSEVDEKYIIKFGDVIFSWSGSLMLKIWNGQNCVLNQHLFKITSKKHPKWFYYFWTKHHLEKFIAIANSKATTMGHIKRGDLSNSLVLVPASKELSKMNDKIAPIFEKTLSNQSQIYTLENLRDTLLPKLMSGKVRVVA